MATNPTASLPVTQLLDAVRRHRSSAREMPLEAVQGYPVPQVHGGRLVLSVPFFRQRGRPPSPPELFAPEWIVTVDCHTAEVTAAAGPGAGDQPLGVHEIGSGLRAKEVAALQLELFSLLDSLLPIVTAMARPKTPQIAARIDRFRTIWETIAHKPLAPYYRRLNPAWFDYLGIQ